MFAKQNAQGQFKEMDDVGRSLSADRRRTAKTSVKSGHGDQGDRPRAASEEEVATRAPRAERHEEIFGAVCPPRCGTACSGERADRFPLRRVWAAGDAPHRRRAWWQKGWLQGARCDSAQLAVCWWSPDEVAMPRVLIVDDDEDVLRLLLQSSGSHGDRDQWCRSARADASATSVSRSNNRSAATLVRRLAAFTRHQSSSGAPRLVAGGATSADLPRSSKYSCDCALTADLTKSY